MKIPDDRHILGVPEMDEQHRYLYSLFARIEETDTVLDPISTSHLLNEIEGYLLFHFTSEEHLIRMYQAPGYTVHKADHEQTGERFISFLEELEKGTLNPLKLKWFLISWLNDHAKTIDEEYARHIKQKRTPV
jgi:hemerythrin